MMDDLTRREFMKHSGAAALGAATLGYGAPQVLRAATPHQPKPTLIVLYLRGGADPINTIIPAADPLYYRIRPTLGVPAHGTPDNPGVLPVTNYFGLHPSMRELAGLYQQGRVAFVLNAGSTHPTRSHFDAQDFMERAAPGVRWVTEGWLNRYLTATRTDDDRPLRAVSLQPTLPRSLRGDYSVLAVPGYGAEHAMTVFESLYGCASEKEAMKDLAEPASARGAAPDTTAQAMRHRVREAGATGISKLRRLNALLRGGEESLAAYPATHLGRQFRDLAKLVKADEGLEIAAVDYNGWDHHAYQGAAVGTMADMLAEVSGTLGAFVEDIGPRVDRTVVLVMSEFGRTVRENGNNGTDHGHAGYMMLVGGPVRGGRLYGKWTGLERGRLYQGRDLPVHTDFRDVFGETLLSLYGFHADDHDFFPEYDANARPLGLLKPRAG